MAPDLLSTLPVELLSIIGRSSSPNDLFELLLTNRSLNESCTPMLYASIDLGYSNLAQKCIRTLSSDPSALAFGRDLPALVRSFSMRFDYYGMPEKEKAKLSRRLSRAVGRMTYLQHFHLAAMFMCSPNVCAALARAAAPTLHSLDIKPDSQKWWADGSDAGVLRGVRSAFPELTTLSLTLWEQDPWLDFFEYILTSRAGQLRKLAINTSPAPMLSSLLRNTPAWSRLQELELNVPDTPLATLPRTPNVRKLTLLWSVDAEAVKQLVLPSDAFPALEVLACPYQLLPKFLPEDAQTPRPIRTVRLNEAYYDETGGDGDFSRGGRPEWEDVLAALSCLPRSTGPVTDLSLYVDWFDASEFGEDMAPYARTLERLLVVLHQDPGCESEIATFGETLFAHAPRLHTFLLSDAPYKSDDSALSFFFAGERKKQLGWLEEWDEHTDALKTVAFTTEFMWTKIEDGWQAPPRRQSEDSDDEDDNDDDEENDDAVESDGSVQLE